MIRSHPPSIFHSADIFKFKLDGERRSPAMAESHDDLQSNPSSHDEESLASPGGYFHENRSSSVEDCVDRPLNLSCKRQRLDDFSPLTTPKSMSSSKMNNESFSNFAQRRSPVAPANQFPNVSNEAVERAILHYRAQILASNEFVRLMMQRRLQEGISSALGRPLIATAAVVPAPSQWIPFESQLYANHLKAAQVQNVHCRSGDPINKKDVTDALTHARFVSPPTPPSANTSPIASPSLSPEINLEVNSLPACSQPGFLFVGGKSIASSPAVNPHPSMYESPNPLPSNISDTNQHDVNVLSPVISESSLSPPMERTRRRRRSKSAAVNSNGDSYPCSICGASYPHKFELNRHVKVSHVRPHRCGQCGKGFGHRNYLKVHIETVHMGQKSHQCRLCGKYLSTGGNLNVHVRTIHLGEKKYNCPVCNRSFGQQCNMKTHMKRHYSKSVDEM